MCGFYTTFYSPLNLDFFMRGGGIKSPGSFKLSFMTRVFIVLLFLISAVMADVKSTTGQIKFDTESDNQSEMTLNSTGLGIGLTPSTNLQVNGNAIVSDQLFIGGSSGSSNLNLNGTLGYGFQTVSSNTTLGDSSIVFVDSSSDNITLTLPYAGNVTGRQYHIKKISTSNSVWISGGGNLIDDTSPIELPESNDLASVKLISDGSQWYKIDQKDISETVASDNLVGWWKLDESSGNIAYDSTNINNDGVITNINSDNVGVNGIINQSINFDGSDDYIELPESSSLLPGDTSFTLSGWFKTGQIYNTPNNDHGGRIITIYRSTVYSTKVSIGFNGDNTDTLTTFYNNGSFQKLNKTSISFNDNEWHQLIATYDSVSNLLSMYYDGVPVASTSAGTIVDSGSLNASIGTFNLSDGFINELVDDVRIYNRALTSSEIQALYDQGQ